jgi:ElaB/YqjD/DUF883 family membrane-anchored ribosome-binding protein
MHICEKCNKEFNFLSLLKRHKETNKNCKDNVIIKCQYCENEFAYKKYVEKHEKKCEKNPMNIKNEFNVKECPNATINNGNNNTNNNNINNICNTYIYNLQIAMQPIKDFDDSNKELFDDPYVMIYIALMHKHSAFTKMIEILNFDDDYPENMNICTKKNKEKINIVMNGKWCERDFKRIYPVVYNNYYDILSNCLDKLKNVLHLDFFNQFENFMDSIGEKDKKIMEEIECQIRDALHDNRDKNTYAQKKIVQVVDNKKKDSAIKMCKEFIEEKFKNDTDKLEIINDFCDNHYEAKSAKKNENEIKKIISAFMDQMNEKSQKVGIDRINQICKNISMKTVHGTHFIKFENEKNTSAKLEELKNSKKSEDSKDSEDSESESDSDYSYNCYKKNNSFNINNKSESDHDDE